MATLYISGVAALWVGKFGGRAAHKDDPEWARRLIARITSTAHAAPTTQVGGGFIDTQKVLGYTTELSFDGRKFELNNTAHFKGTHTVEITNRGTETVTYKFSVQDAGGYTAYTPSVPGQTQFAVPGIPLYADLDPFKLTPEVSLPQEITIAAGETKSTEYDLILTICHTMRRQLTTNNRFTFSVPEGADAKKLPVYSGKILVSGSNGEELGIPYFGVASDLKETIENVWDYGWNNPYLASGVNAIKLEQKSNFTFNLTREVQDFPKLFTQFVWGTKKFRWDIFSGNYSEAQWLYPPVVS
ncbi:minor extracellular protease vpr [Colletotrichum cuscutae]|uniref:Minor extracellular protease vpr n=1 Tax=Colletotrichum cuscutae TaxID=1209917 RepID=A0AAJ0DLZ9_9PEZI|nr:minor extracellular protease vpr [Colletotrichum cuscutae]